HWLKFESLARCEASGRTTQQASIEEAVETSPLDELALAESKCRHHHAAATHPAFRHQLSGAGQKLGVRVFRQLDAGPGLHHAELAHTPGFGNGPIAIQFYQSVLVKTRRPGDRCAQ